MSTRSPEPFRLGRLLKSWALIALGVVFAAAVSSGIHYESAWTLALVAIVLSLLNALLRPLLILFALPFVVLTFGLGILIINALLLYLTGWLVSGFIVEGFWWALWGAFLIALTSILVNTLLGQGARGNVRVHINRPPRGPHPQRRPLDKADDVIDV
jgi:putative membrane protein